MKTGYYIVLFAIGLTACSALKNVPVDDAYYCAGDESVLIVPDSHTPVLSEETNPNIEYLNVQDTVVTIRIKK